MAPVSNPCGKHFFQEHEVLQLHLNLKVVVSCFKWGYQCNDHNVVAVKGVNHLLTCLINQVWRALTHPQVGLQSYK